MEETITQTHCFIWQALPFGERVDIEWHQKSVDEFVCEDLVKCVNVDQEDVIEVVQVIQVFSYQISQAITAPMAGDSFFN